MRFTINKHGKILSAAADLKAEGDDLSILSGFSFYTLVDDRDSISVKNFIDQVVSQSDILSCHLRLHLNQAKESTSLVCFGMSSADRESVHLSLREIPSTLETQRKKLDDAKERLRLFFQQMPIAILIVNGNGMVQAVNSSAERLFGCTSRELAGKSTSDLFIEGAPDLKAQTTMETAQAVMSRITARRHTQSVALEYCVQILDRSDDLYLLCLVDISERIALEKLKQEFVAMVSHDLKAPLSCLQANISLLLDGKAEIDSSSGKETLKDMESESTKLMKFIEDLLDLTRLESGKFVMERHSTPLWPIIQRAARNVSRQTSEKSILLALPDTELEAMVDGERIVQVLTNLLTNAIKASAPGAEIKVTCQDFDHAVDVRVIDSGCGLSEADRELVFEKFVRGEDRHAGTGLGLSICKAIVEQHGGTIGVDTVYGAGATFWFRLPCA